MDMEFIERLALPLIGMGFFGYPFRDAEIGAKIT